VSKQTTTLEFVLEAVDKASEKFEHVGSKVEGTSGKLSKLKVAGGLALGGAAVAAVKFGKDSAEAYEDAEAKQRKLEDAYNRFPKLADTNLESLRNLNKEIEHKTGLDDDDLAAAQAQLAQFGLTGKQLEKLTPLVADYATKTGKDLPDAAKALGLALGGNQKALKQIGVNLPAMGAGTAAVAQAQRNAAAATDNLQAKERTLADIRAVNAGRTKLTVGQQIQLRNAITAVHNAQDKAKTATQNVTAAQKAASASGSRFDQVMSGLSTKVGGFAEKDAESAAGKSRIFAVELEDLKEKVGAGISPALEKLTSIGIKVVGWLQKTPGAMTAVSVALGIGAVAWAAMTLAASPWLAIGLGIGAVVAGIILVVKNWGSIGPKVAQVWDGVWSKVKGAFSAGWAVIKKVFAYTPIGVIVTHWGAITSFFGSIPGKIRAFVDAAKGFIVKAFSYTPLGLVVTHFGAVVDFVKGIPGKIVGALGDLGSMLFGSGRDVVQGLINGAGSLLSKIGEFFLDKIPGWIKTPFKKALGIASPSKVFHEYGKNVVQGLLNGVDALSDKLEKKVAKLADKVADAASKLNDLKSSRAQLRDTVASNVTGGLDLTAAIPQATTDAFGYTHAARKMTFQDVGSKVHALAAKAKTFAGKLSAMVKKGIPAGLVQQVAGITDLDQGIAVADAFLSGSAADVRGLQADWSSLQRSGTTAGNAVAGQQYNAQITKQQAEVDRLKAAEARAKADEKLAKNLAKELAKELRAHPGSVTLVVDRRQAGLLVQAGNDYGKKHS